MAFTQAPKIVTDGLIFYHDMYNPKKGFVGKATTNYAYTHNARNTDSSYSRYVYTTSGTWQAKHPDAITVYNKDGSDISNYVNSGVPDYTNTYHAIWILDPELGRPVVAMRDIGTGEWLAKSFGLGYTYTSMGLIAGQTYTISWLQWTDNLSKSAHTGLYAPNLSGSYNFYDGQSNSQGTSFNTKLRTWQRVYATFTVTSGLNMTAGLTCYMYGMYGPRGVLKVADVQIEVGSTKSGFSETLTRSATSCAFDQTGNYSGLSLVNMTYNNNDEYTFNGSSSYIDFGSNKTIKSHGGWTVETWAYFDTMTSGNLYNFIGADGYTYNSWFWSVYTNRLAIWNLTPGAWYYGSTTLSAGQWYHCTLVCSGDGTSYTMYLNGVPETGTAASYSFNPSQAGLIVRYIGRGDAANARYHAGRYGSTKIYNRPLFASEVSQNFQAHRRRYGL